MFFVFFFNFKGKLMLSTSVWSSSTFCKLTLKTFVIFFFHLFLPQSRPLVANLEHKHSYPCNVFAYIPVDLRSRKTKSQLPTKILIYRLCLQIKGWLSGIRPPVFYKFPSPAFSSNKPQLIIALLPEIIEIRFSNIC